MGFLEKLGFGGHKEEAEEQKAPEGEQASAPVVEETAQESPMETPEAAMMPEAEETAPEAEMPTEENKEGQM